MCIFFRLEDRITVYPADVVLFEGILVFYPQKVRDMFHMKLFVDTDSDVRLSRRGINVYLTQNILILMLPQSINRVWPDCPCSSARHGPRERPGADSHSVHNLCQTCFWGVLFACKYDSYHWYCAYFPVSYSVSNPLIISEYICFSLRQRSM